MLIRLSAYVMSMRLQIAMSITETFGSIRVHLLFNKGIMILSLYV